MSATRNDLWMVLDSGHVVGRRDTVFSNEEILDLLHEAHADGFDLSPGSALETVTVAELKLLVSPEGLPC